MDARTIRLAHAALSMAAILSLGASARSENFLVTASTPEFAERVAQTAETLRRDLAVHWLGVELPRWSQPCPIVVQDGERLGAGGATSFLFDRGEVFGWQMNIQGTQERLLDSVLPHEITHTVFASHFRQPLPRWADEGACTTIEHDSERGKHQRMLVDFLKTGRGISFSRMFAMKDYPRDVLPLYSQGHSLATFLIDRGGPRKFVQYVGAGLASEQWPEATRRHYGFENLQELQDAWMTWVRQGSRTTVIRGQSPEAPAASDPGEQARDIVQNAEASVHGSRGKAANAGLQLASAVDDEPIESELVPVALPRRKRAPSQPSADNGDRGLGRREALADASQNRPRRLPGPHEPRATDRLRDQPAPREFGRAASESEVDAPQIAKVAAAPAGRRNSVYARRSSPARIVR